jgi:hypothetical protein
MCFWFFTLGCDVWTRRIGWYGLGFGNLLTLPGEFGVLRISVVGLVLASLVLALGELWTSGLARVTG